MAPGQTPEIISGGHGEPAPRWLPLAWAWLRPRPWALTLAALGTTGVLLATAAVGPRLVPGLVPRPPGPQVVVAPLGDDGTVVGVDPWSADGDGRPVDPPVLSVGALLRRADRASGPDDVTVLGVTGTGVVRRDNPPVPLPAGTRPVEAAFRAVLDCSEIRADTLPDPYRLRLRYTRDGRTRDAVLPAGPLGERWSAAAWVACASWSARRDLTVTTATARVDAHEPRVDLTLAVTNAGRREATLIDAGSDADLRLEGPFPARLPPGTTRRVTLTMALDRCDLATGLPPTDVLAVRGPGGSWPGGPSGTTELFGLTAIGGSPPALATAVARLPAPGFGEGRAPTGIVLSAQAGPAVAAGVRAACGGIGPLVMITESAAVIYDRVRRELTVPVLIDVTPGLVRSMTLQNDPEAARQPDALEPLPSVVADLVPDRSGQARTVLRYRVPSSGPCPRPNTYFLPSLVAVLHLRTADRVVRLSTFVDARDPGLTRVLCGD